MPMKIDYLATKEKLLSTGRAITKWSRLHKLPAGSVTALLNNRFIVKEPTEGVHGEIIAALKEDGFLVVVPDVDNDQAA